ncbi:MAG: hypothetical protein KY467_14290 [Gemmatimonadetes bacterium]|nr:hypothetical protein [Gemmatimonadota bacterium]
MRTRRRQMAFVAVEDNLRLDLILYAFWAVFWLLNGLDKFFNGTQEVGPFGPRTVGWFGVNRDEKFIDYFSRLYLPEEMALAALYTFAVVEIVVGAVFLVMLLRPRVDTMVHRLAFKMNMLLFFAFSVGDILFGDRQELWEHGTFMILTLMTYQLYLARSAEHAEVLGPEYARAADLNQDNRVSTEEFDQFMDRLRTACVAPAPPEAAAPKTPTGIA